MKKLLSILLLCFCFSATAQDYNNWIYNNGNIEIEDFNYTPPVTDNNMSVAFPAPTFIDFVGGWLQAYVNGNPVSEGVGGSTLLEDGSGGVAVIGTDALCNCDIANNGEEIQFAILMNNEIVVNVDVYPPVIYYANTFHVGLDVSFNINGANVLFGCMDNNYLEFNPSANIDNGSCEVVKVDGCTDSQACNYYSEANFDDGSCLYLDYEQSLFNACCLGNSITTICLLDEDICSSEDVDCITYGCTELWADNYNPFITQDDGSCYKMGCISDWADNYDAIATTDDGSCDKLGCVSVWADNYDALATTDDGNCYRIGCVSDWADNFDEYATIDDESCYRYGCTSNLAVNYDEYATIDNDNCDFDIITHLNMSFDAWNISIDLSEGWNMFGYGCPSSIDVADGLSNHSESIIITKDNNGNVYMPEFGFNGIGNFTPGFGYQIKVTEAIEGFSLCDWYVNDIPEDNIVSLQEEVESLQSELDSIYGCIDETACNYEETASLDDGSCYNNDLGCGCDTPGPIEGYDCDGNCLDLNNNNLCDTNEIWGCLNVLADNYNINANIDDGSCVISVACPYENYFEYNPNVNYYDVDYCHTLIVYGCTDINSTSYNYEANQDDGSCIYFGCMDSLADNFSLIANQDDGNCIYYGCMDEYSDNYTELANQDDESCYTYGCTLEDFPNYNEQATIDDGSCDMSSNDVYGCNDYLGVVCNFNPNANINNGSCIYAESGYNCEGDFLSVGMEINGGIVFYIDETGQHGLVAAIEDLGMMPWGCWGTELSAYGQAIGTGYQNTLDIVSGCSETPIAASEALAYESGGYSDWYLPSKDELVEMYSTIGNGGPEGNIGGFETSPRYWCSSEDGCGDAWGVSFDNGFIGNFAFSKSFNYRVRVIRAF